MSKTKKHQWEFKPKFRAGLYSWNGSAKATKNLRAAVSEIRKGYKTDPLEAVDAAICLMGRFWPTFRNIDSSSGALSAAVNNTIEKSDRPQQAWFSSARKCGLYDIALQCAESGPVNPRTLATAARDTLDSHPNFSWRISALAVKYILIDYVDVSEYDVITAVRNIVEAARNAGKLDEALEALRQVLDLRKKAQKIPRIVREELKRLGVSAPL